MSPHSLQATNPRSWTQRGCAVTVVCLLACTGNAGSHGYVLKRTLPHDTTAYTQGLLHTGGLLYESIGEYGRSELRRVQLLTGHVLGSVKLPTNRFAEGIALLGEKLYQLTWQSQVGYVYDAVTLALVDSFAYEGEGWGLTSDGESLIMSDGTAVLRVLDPRTYRVTRRVTVRDGSSALSQINELEYVRGELFANIYQSDWIVRIDLASGQIRQWIDFAELLPVKRRNPATDVLNGIAYIEDTGLLLVTGKRWPFLFEVQLTPPVSDSARQFSGGTRPNKRLKLTGAPK